ncbi:MAG TPA: class I SAM-dependent methyltransferase [Solirubrobacteraceae bacterium]|jgi:demethylmenaquinone methyltransferase/2-methoxy-6-polyprenyl-1,4-benzoquinol methylase|nr:class I SAM-dependent methyltransferase [Solirubrobacteraceae bacterium]
MSSPATNDADGVAPRSTRAARKQQALELFRELPARYDELSAALSFWQDPRWRRALVDAAAPRDGERVLDVACGTGLVSAELRSRCDCAVVALDQSEEMLARARARFAGEPAGAVQLLRGEAEALPFPPESFDAVTFTYLLRYVDDPRATVAELARVIRPGGRMAMLEFGVPPWAPARAAWELYTRAGLPLLGGLFGAQWREVGRFLGPSIRAFYARHPVEAIVGYWRDAGLRDVRVRRMSFGGGIVLDAVRDARRHPDRP